MNYILTAATAVSKEAGSMSEMLPKFGVIALVVVIILIGMFIYAKKKKETLEPIAAACIE